MIFSSTPAAGGRNLGVDLVRGHLQQRFIDLDGIPDLLQPLGDSAFCDGFAQFGHFDGVRHGVEAPKKDEVQMWST
jgi:hypothetical protein